MGTASNEYLRNTVLTASPEQLHLMLYDGAIRFARQGIDGIASQQWESAFNGLTRAQKIVLELLNSLNYDVDADLCKRMAGLYNFIYGKLVEAGTQRDVDAGREALDLLEYQRETWIMLIEKLRGAQPNVPRPASGHAAPETDFGTLSVES